VERTNHQIDAVIYFLFAGLALATLTYLCYFNPVVYTRLVNEDQWGEYGTAVGFGFGGVALLVLCAKSGRLSRRVLWAFFGLVALVIAGEELSWGQRIFNIATPETFYTMNTQGELNLHNFGAVDTLLNRSGLLRQTASFLILGWSALCLLASIFTPRVVNRLEEAGLPVIPPRLLPFFLMVPFFFIVKPLARSDEIGELFLAAAVAAWTIDLWLRHTISGPPRNGKCALIVLGLLLGGGLLAAALAWKFPGSFKGSLNHMAQHTYPGRKMYAQADQIYRYIYAHPHLLKPDTRLQHARMLLSLGQTEQAREVLLEAQNALQGGPGTKEEKADFLRRKGIVHALLGEADSAETYFDESIALERRLAEQTPDPDEKADLLWSVAQTLEARGDRTGALETARQARDVCRSARKQRRLTEWIHFLVDPVAAQAEKEL